MNPIFRMTRPRWLRLLLLLAIPVSVALAVQPGAPAPAGGFAAPAGSPYGAPPKASPEIMTVQTASAGSTVVLGCTVSPTSTCFLTITP